MAGCKIAAIVVRADIVRTSASTIMIRGGSDCRDPAIPGYPVT